MNQNQSPVINFATFHNLKESMGDVFSEIIEVFVEETDSLIDQMSQQIDTNDLDGVRMTAHTLKSSTQMIGAYRLSSICAEIESLQDHEFVKASILFDEMELENKRVKHSIGDE